MVSFLPVGSTQAVNVSPRGVVRPFPRVLARLNSLIMVCEFITGAATAQAPSVRS
ncbi:hypothetical protein SAMN05216554_3697 [Herbiconiux ginsengi]|uniref:Uncharacterized protein n=1 Tax=Herbiconiux ginsengi TaxID=381665 RepID=A0A1H3SUQ5_9MICO|nr:hypothetical protein SAMN05216554_3697 [Herbiconiux ginsengi]